MSKKSQPELPLPYQYAAGRDGARFGEEDDFLLVLDPLGRIAGLPQGLPPLLDETFKAKMGRSLSETCSMRDVQRIDSVLRGVLKGVTSEPARAEIVSPSGAVAECLLRFTRIDGMGGELAGLLVAGRLGRKTENALELLPARALARLMDLGAAFNLETETSALAVLACRGAMTLVRADFAAVWIKDAVTGLLRLAAHSDSAEPPYPRAIHEGDGVIGMAFARGKPVLEAKRPADLPREDPAVALGCLSYVHVPLLHEGLPLGVLSAWSYVESRFGQEELDLMRGLAEIAASGFVRLHRQGRVANTEISTRRVLDSAPLGIVSMNSEGRVTHANTEASRLFGADPREPEKLVGRNLFSSDAVLRNGLSQLLVRLLHAGDPFDRDIEDFSVPNAPTRSLRVQGRPVRDETGRVVGGAVYAQRIATDEVGGVEAQEDLYWDFFEKTGDGVLIFTKDMEIVDANDAAARLLGKHRADLPGMRLPDVTHRPLPLIPNSAFPIPHSDVAQPPPVANQSAEGSMQSAVAGEGAGATTIANPSAVGGTRSAVSNVADTDSHELLTPPPDVPDIPHSPLPIPHPEMPLALPKRVLVAEDEEGLRQFCFSALSRQGWDVTIAVDGQEAVEIFEATGGDFDLVLLDMVMPRLNGESAFRKMHAIKPEVPVLLSSGYAKRFLHMDVPKGLAGFVEKPYVVADLVDTVRRFLENAKAT